MKLPRQLAYSQYAGKAQSEVVSARAIGGREILAGVALLVLFVSIDRFSITTSGLNLRLELIAGGLLALWFFVRSRGAVLQRLGIIEYSLLGWLAANVFASLAFSPSPPESLKNAVIIAGVLTIYAVGLMVFNSMQAITWAAVVWVGIGAVVAIMGLASAFLYTFFGWTGGINLERAYTNGIFLLTPRVQSTVWEPNIFGSYCVTVGILALALSLSPEFSTPRRQWGLRLAAGCAFCGVMLSMTRTVWFVGPLVLVVLMLLSLWLKLASIRQVLTGMLVPAGVGIVIGLVVGNFLIPSLRWERSNPWDLTYSQVEQAVPYLIKGVAPPPDVANPSGVAASPPVTQTAPTPVPTTIASGAPAPDPGTAAPAAPAASQGKDTQVSSGSTLIDKLNQLFSPENSTSVQNRLSIFSNTVDGWLRHPVLGWGTGSYPLLFPPNYIEAYWIANVELHILFDTGIVGLVLFAIPVVVAARRGVRALSRSKLEWSTAHFIVLGLLVAGAGLLFAYQITDATWLGFTWVFFALLVTATGIAAQAKTQARATNPAEANAP